MIPVNQMHYFIRYVFLLWLLFHTGFAMGQADNLFHKSFGSEDGLDIGSVSTMAFDNDGFLWLGGSNMEVRAIILSEKANKLHRFNGIGFDTVELPKTDETARGIAQILKREDGKFYVLVRRVHDPIWYLFDPISLQFELLDIGKVTSSSNIFSFENNNYVLIQNGVEITLHQVSETFEFQPLLRFELPEFKFTLDSTTKLIAYEDYFVISDDNFPITFIDWKGNILKMLPRLSPKDPETNKRKRIWIDEYYTQNDTTFVFLLENSLLHYIDTKVMEVKPTKRKGDQIENIHLNAYTDPHGQSIVLSMLNNNLSLHKPSQNGLTPLYQKKAFNSTFSLKAISHDISKDIWIATGANTLLYYKFPSEAIKTFLNEQAIRFIDPFNDTENLVTTENSGWFLFNEEKFSLERFYLNEDGSQVSPESTRNFIHMREKSWINYRSGLGEIDRSDWSIRYHRHFPVICLEQLNDTTLVYGTSGYNLMRFNTRTKKHSPIIKTDSLFIYDIAIKDDFLVGATDKGVLTYDFVSEKTQLYNNEGSIGDLFWLMVDATGENEFMVGSRNGTMVTFNSKNQQFSQFYKDDLQAGIATILFDDSTAWINTFNGLVAYDTLTKTKARYATKDGLSHNEANRYSALKTKNGMLMGALKGLNYFKPSDLKIQEQSSELVLLKLQKFDAETNRVISIRDRSELAQENTIILPAEKKELELDFSLTNAITPNENSYRYRLNNSEWIDLKKQSSIRFANLAAGTYDLEIEARNFSGDLMGSPLRRTIQSKNFFYKTAWFFLLLFSGILALVAWMYYQFMLRKKLQEQFSENLLLSQETERTRIAKELHDSVGQQLTLIKKKAQNANKPEISSLTNNALEEVRAISRGLFPATLKQLGLSESIEQLVYDLDEETNLFFSSEVAQVDSFFTEDQTLHVYRFIQESLTNILKHSEATSVTLSVLNQQQNVSILIHDNGKGFNVSEKSKINSLGLKTLAERIRILHGSLSFESRPNDGTIIRAEIPISK